MDAINYLVKGKKAYDEGDFKLAMVLLRRTGLCHANTVELYANAAYESWRSPTCNISPSEIKEAYNLMFKSSDASMIKPFEYVRLAQIYISYGLLVGAMEVMRLAADVGNLDQCMILLQTWTLMRKLSSTKQTNEYMEAIAEMITMQVFDKSHNDDDCLFLKGTDIPLYAVYLHCAFHTKRAIVQNKFRFRYEKDNALQKYNATMSEAYTFYFKRHPLSHKVVNDWFEDPETWMEMGRVLEGTSVPLLAEESYWICFVHDPLHEEAIFATLGHLQKTRRPHEAFKFLEKAYWANSWNVRIRDELQAREEGCFYKDRFRNDIEAARKIQAAYRGHFTRKYWEYVYEASQVARAEYMETVDRGRHMRALNLARMHHRRLLQWRHNVIALRDYKRACSVTIQMCWRCFSAKKRRLVMMQRMRNANKKYFFMSEFHHNLHRLEIFKEWTRVMRVTRSNRCAELLKTFITTSERRKKFYWAGDKLRRFFQIRKQHAFRIVMRKWHTNFVNRQRRHAVACLRFFVRGVFVKIRNRRREAQISLITNNAALKEVQQRLSQRLLREKFATWRGVFVARQSEISFRTLSKRMPIMYARFKARRKLGQLRVCREFVLARGEARRFREFNLSFYRWRLLTSCLRIQRMARVFLATRALRRRVVLRRRLLAFGVKRVGHCKARHIENWRQFIKRRRFRRKMARNCIVNFMRKYSFFLRLGRQCAKNRKMLDWLRLVDMKHKRKCLGQLHRMVFGVKQYEYMKKMCAILNRLVLTDAFEVFRSGARDRGRMAGLVAGLIEGRMNRVMERAAAREGWRYRSKSGYSGGTIEVVNTTAEGSAVDTRGWPSVLNCAASRVHITAPLFEKKKIFQAWAFVYRLRIMRKVEMCVQDSPAVLTAAAQAFAEKKRRAVSVQKWVRGWQAVACSRRRRLALQVHWEKVAIVRDVCKHRFRRRHFQEMAFLSLYAKSARVLLQCWARQCLARRALRRRKIELGVLQNKEFVVFKMYRRNALSKILRMMEFGCVLRCCAIQLSSPRERHQQAGGARRPLQSLDISSSSSRQQQRSRTTKMKPLTIKDFCSEEYHSHMFRLKQTGVLVVDSSNLTALKPNELAFLIQSATTLFSQASGEHHAISNIANNFLGNKLIFCGGMISAANAYDLYYLLTSREEKICINFSEVAVCFKAVTKIARSLDHNFAKIRELSIDSDSMGSLGIAALLVSLKGNLTLETFALKITSPESLIACHEECVKTLVQNSYLRELRLFGVPLTRGIISGLTYAVSYGFCRLALLEFDYLTRDTRSVHSLVDIGKSRERKHTGSNTFVNVTEIWTPDDA